MEVGDLISPSHVIVGLRVSDKSRLLDELARRAAGSLDLSAQEIASALIKREELGSTGTGGGVALPHARFPGLSKPFGLLVRLSKAIDFDAIDGNPVDIVCLVLLPASAQESQLNALACVARTLRNADVVRGIRRADDKDEAYRTIIKERQ
jgi:nitrogen PTS system EIIA component